jgi:hypothetical protein
MMWTGSREAGVRWGAVYICRSAGLRVRRLMPPFMNTLTNTSAYPLAQTADRFFRASAR